MCVHAHVCKVGRWGYNSHGGALWMRCVHVCIDLQKVASHRGWVPETPHLSILPPLLPALQPHTRCNISTSHKSYTRMYHMHHVVPCHTETAHAGDNYKPRKFTQLQGCYVNQAFLVLVTSSLLMLNPRNAWWCARF